MCILPAFLKFRGQVELGFRVLGLGCFRFRVYDFILRMYIYICMYIYREAWGLDALNSKEKGRVYWGSAGLRRRD